MSEQRPEVRAMPHDRVALFCPRGHECVSTQATSRLGVRLLAGDFSGEWWQSWLLWVVGMSEYGVEKDRPVRNVHYEGRNLRERLTACVEMWQSTGPKQQSTRDLLTDLIGILGEYDPTEGSA